MPKAESGDLLIFNANVNVVMVVSTLAAQSKINMIIPIGMPVIGKNRT